MGEEREHDGSADEGSGRSSGSGRAKDDDPKGPKRSAEWTTSTYRSKRRVTEVRGTASKTPRRPPPDAEPREDERPDEEP